jgi:plastocyanin
MHFSIVFLLSVLPCTFAQGYGGGSGGGTTTSTSAASLTTGSSTSVHTVAAGNGNLAYSPNSITAAVGDTIEFHFFAPLHSVAESTFASPCTPSNASAFFSGDISTSSGQNTNVFTLAINDTNPIWFYCVIPTHCQAGMVGVINPP